MALYMVKQLGADASYYGRLQSSFSALLLLGGLLSGMSFCPGGGEGWRGVLQTKQLQCTAAAGRLLPVMCCSEEKDARLWNKVGWRCGTLHGQAARSRCFPLWHAAKQLQRIAAAGRIAVRYVYWRLWDFGEGGCCKPRADVSVGVCLPARGRELGGGHPWRTVWRIALAGRAALCT